MLNDVLDEAKAVAQPPSDKGKRLKIYFAAQIGVKPPLFSFQVNDRNIMHFSYARYLENSFRRAWDFAGTPIKVEFKQKEKLPLNQIKDLFL